MEMQVTLTRYNMGCSGILIDIPVYICPKCKRIHYSRLFTHSRLHMYTPIVKGKTEYLNYLNIQMPYDKERRDGV